MSSIPNTQGIDVQIYLQAGFEELMFHVPLAGTAVLGSFDAGNDVATRVLNDWLSPIKNAMSGGVEIRGLNITGMVKGHMLPVRIAFTSGSNPGSIGGDALPPNCSVLFTRYSKDQIQLTDRTIVGKSFFAPPPESQSDGPILKTAFLAGQLTTLATVLRSDFVGTSGASYKAVVASNRAPGDLLWPVDAYAIRSIVATQRRRLQPHA